MNNNNIKMSDLYTRTIFLLDDWRHPNLDAIRGRMYNITDYISIHEEKISFGIMKTDGYVYHITFNSPEKADEFEKFILLNPTWSEEFTMGIMFND